MKLAIPYCALALICATAASLSFSFGLFSGIEYFFEDLLFSEKPLRDDMVIISIDNESLGRIGQWPWPRAIFAELVSKLNAHPPAALGIDVIFSEPSRLGTADDEILANALEKIKYPIILPVEGEKTLLAEQGNARAATVIKPLRAFTQSKNVSLGHVNLILDRDGVVRKFPVTVYGTNANDPQRFRAFAVETLARSGKSIPPRQQKDELTRIVFAAPVGTIRRVPFSRLLEEEMPELEGKILFIGATAPDLHDTQQTPFSHGSEMPGVEIQAHMANMVLSGYALRELPRAIAFSWITLTALLPVAFFLLIKRPLRPLLSSAIASVMYLILIVILFENGIVTPGIHIIMSSTLSTAALFSYRHTRGERERREMRNLFSKYVSSSVLEEILRDPRRVTLGGAEKEITILFSDIRGFTTLSEQTQPQKLLQILNEYFTAMTEEILKEGGVVDKYIGDAIMAFWGAPIEDPRQADRALRAALGMLNKLSSLNEEFRRRSTPEIHIGIGLYTGRVVAGNVGSHLRFNYTIIGDAVNVASRLEGLTKEYRTPLLIGESTQQKITDKVTLTRIGASAVKGRKEPVTIYRVENLT